jgi:hypothetical protein
MPPHQTGSADKKAFHSYQIRADLEEASIRPLGFHGFAGKNKRSEIIGRKQE